MDRLTETSKNIQTILNMYQGSFFDKNADEFCSTWIIPEELKIYAGDSNVYRDMKAQIFELLNQLEEAKKTIDFASKHIDVLHDLLVKELED
jgi:hypothetical protein